MREKRRGCCEVEGYREEEGRWGKRGSRCGGMMGGMCFFFQAEDGIRDRDG